MVSAAVFVRPGSILKGVPVSGMWDEMIQLPFFESQVQGSAWRFPQKQFVITAGRLSPLFRTPWVIPREIFFAAEEECPRQWDKERKEVSSSACP